MKTTTLLILALLLALPACDTPRDNTNTQPESAEAGPQGEWTLVSLNGAPLLEGTRASLRIDGGDAGGNASCNGFGGEVEVDGEEIAFSDLAITSMACMGEGIHGQENAVMAVLNAAERWSVEGDTLTIRAGDEGVLVYERVQPEADQPLEGTTWEAQTFIEGELASSLVANTTITLTLEDGALSGNTGCNSMNGTYTVDGSSIQLSVTGVTEMACADPGAMEQEGRYLDALRAVETYSVEGSMLRMESADGALGLDFRAP